MNSGDDVVHPDISLLSRSATEFSNERWFFINGIMVGNQWLDSAINELSVLFKREVCGIRNRTLVLTPIYPDGR